MSDDHNTKRATKRARLAAQDGFADGMSNEEIRAIVAEIALAQGSPDHKATAYKDKFPEFVERYPVLFEMACARDFDMRRFEYMMAMRERIGNKQETVESASKEVGRVMFEDYVKPIVESTPPDKQR